MKKYKALTLLELIIVMSVIFILSWISILSYRSLTDSFSINEVSLTIAQDIRGVQRSAMLLDRDSAERWLYGVGLDFSRIEEEREYDIFKWCSPFNYYDESEASLTGELPNYAGGEISPQANLPLVGPDGLLTDCDRVASHGSGTNGLLVTETKRFGDYNNLDFELFNGVTYILFESVSGKAFFYDTDLKLLNYELSDGEIFLSEANRIDRFRLRLEPIRGSGLAGRSINVHPVSGIVFFEFDN